MRSHYCGQVNEKLVGQEVTVAGWVHRRRDHGGVIFVDLRDREGLLQVVFDPDNQAQFNEAEKLRNEFVVQVRGLVRERPAGTANANLTSGKVELLARELVTLNRAEPLPFQDGVHGEQLGAVGEAPLVETVVVFANEKVRHRVSEGSTGYHAAILP